jgi:CBS domain-containing protein
VSLGSDGRKEQTFKTDQDNAIIYANPETTAQEVAIRNYFAEFTGFVKDSLLRCGFPPCPADYMPTNPTWCQPLRMWKEYIADWVSTPTPDALLNALNFFDFRPLHGENSLAEDLRTYLIGTVKDQKTFLGHLANMAIKNSPPIGFFKSFVVEKDGEHKNELNLKVKGVAPLVDIIRLFALESGIRETSTLERIAALRASHTIIRAYADEFERAFEFIMLLRIHHQFSQLSAGGAPVNFINPNRLSNLEKKSIKDAFYLITMVQGLIIERYKSQIR